jgi:hypothetical protein
MSATGAGLRGRRHRGTREPVVGVGPGIGLLGVEPRRCDLVHKVGELMAAALADGSERDGVPGQVQRDLVGLSGPVTASHGGDGQYGAIDAA